MISLTKGMIKSYGVLFLKNYSEYKSEAITFFPKIVRKKKTKVQQGGSEKIYIPSSLPSMEKWKRNEDRPMGDRYKLSHSIYIDRYGIGIEIDKAEFENDELGVKQDLNMYAREAKAKFPTLALEMLAAGATNTYGVCFDGKNLFSSTHKLFKASINNTGTKVFGAEGLGLALKYFADLKDDHNKPMKINPTHILYHPANEQEVLKQLNSIQIEGTTNVNKGRLIPIACPYFATDTEYIVLAANKAGTGVLGYLENKISNKPDIDDITAMFMKGKVYYGIEALAGLGYLDFRLAFRSTGAVA